MPPQYVPLPTPEQQAALVRQKMGSASNPQGMTFDQWYVKMYGGSPYGNALRQQQAQQKKPGIGDLFDIYDAYSKTNQAASGAGTVGNLGISTGGSASSTLGYNAGSNGLGFMNNAGSIADSSSALGGSGGSTIGAGVPPSTGTPWFDVGGPSYAGYLSAAMTAGKGLYDGFTKHGASSEKQAQAAQAAAAMTAANYFTGGLASVADGLAGGRLTKGLGKLSGHINKLEDNLTFGLTKKVRGKIFHQDTRGRQNDVTAKLLGEHQDDKVYQDYVNKARAGFGTAPTDPSKPFFGKYANFKEYEKAGLDAGDLSAVEGNIKVYGKDWAHATDDQRKAVTQKNIDKKLYASKDGGVQLTDEDLAKQSWDEVMKNPGANTASIMIPKARSPGFDKNGKRINYAR